MADPSEDGDIDPMASTVRPDERGPFACTLGEIYAGEYRIDSLIGRGGMGEVYAVTHRTLHAPFALKVLRKGYRQRADIVARFRAESRALFELSHPGFVRVHHAGEDADIGPYMVMELLRGRSLFQLMHQIGPFPESQAIALAIDIAEAAAVMHGLGIVHRDLKPENVFLADGQGDSPKVKLLDLGAAKIEKYGNPATTDNKTVGTGRYMAPEHIRCLPVSPETDVYSLGHILYEMVAGTHPFESSKPDPSHLEFQVWHLGMKPVPLRVKRPQASPGLEALVAQAMDKDIAHRFRSMLALSSALSALQASAHRRAGGTVALELEGAVKQRPSRPTETADVRTSRDPIPRSLIVGASLSDATSDTEIGPPLPLHSLSSEVAREVRLPAEDGQK